MNLKKNAMQEQETENALNELGKWIPVAMMVIAAISFVITFVVFIKNGGYTEQIHTVKENSVFSLFGKFTGGNSTAMTDGIAGAVMKLLGVGQVLVILANYCKKTMRENKLASIASFVVLGIGGVMYLLYSGIQNRYISLSDKMQQSLAQKLVELQGPTLNILLGIGVAIIGIPIIYLLITILQEEYRWMIFSGVGAWIVSRYVLPLILVFLENVIPLGITALIIIAVLIGLFLFGVIMESGGSHSVSMNDDAREREEKYMDTKKKEPQKEEHFRDTLTVGFGVTAYKVHGYQHDYIECSNGHNSSKFCSLADFRKNYYKIVDSHGNRLYEDDLPWKSK